MGGGGDALWPGAKKAKLSLISSTLLRSALGYNAFVADLPTVPAMGQLLSFAQDNLTTSRAKATGVRATMANDDYDGGEE